MVPNSYQGIEPLRVLYRTISWDKQNPTTTPNCDTPPPSVSESPLLRQNISTTKHISVYRVSVPYCSVCRVVVENKHFLAFRPFFISANCVGQSAWNYNKL